MQRATKIFLLEERQGDSPFIDTIWRTRSAPRQSFISVAASHWEIVIWRQAGQTHVTVRGPETKATTLPIPADAEFFGVQFRPGAFMPDLPVLSLVDRELTLLRGIGNSFRLHGSVFETPSYDNIDAFVNRLAREGLLVSDPIVSAALQGRQMDLSRRSIERRVPASDGSYARHDQADRKGKERSRTSGPGRNDPRRGHARWLRGPGASHPLVETFHGPDARSNCEGGGMSDCRFRSRRLAVVQEKLRGLAQPAS